MRSVFGVGSVWCEECMWCEKYVVCGECVVWGVWFSVVCGLCDMGSVCVVWALSRVLGETVEK